MPTWTNGNAILAEVGTMQLEFASVASATNKSEYAEIALRVYESLKQHEPKDQLFPCLVNPDSGGMGDQHVTLGSLGDSFYEYLIKYYLITDKKADNVGKWHYQIAESVIQHLGVQVGNDGPSSSNYSYALYDRSGSQNNNKFDHFACFASGMFALDAIHSEDKSVKERHMLVAKGIGKFCRNMYTMTQSQLPYDMVFFNPVRSPVPSSLCHCLTIYAFYYRITVK